MKIERLKGFEDFYLIDEKGNVISIPRENGISNQYTNYYVIRGKIDKYGYVRVVLSKNGNQKEFLLHRLIALQFIPNPNNLPQVNHKNGIKTDNSVGNLEWCTAKENKRHAYNNLPSTKKACLENIEKINAKKAYHRIILKKNGESLTFGNTNEVAAFLHCHKDKVSHAIRHNLLLKGYRLIGYKELSANGED